ncbi:MAG: HPF/RaiA family ribosome-associated protein [Colwellia sp.]|nr:HPF/RaiA family ribosome-associated protein [Colwellia sp.]
MQISIHTSGIALSKELTTHIQRKMRLALSRQEPYINTISILLTSVVETKNNNHKHCRLTLAIVNRPDIVIEDTQMDLNCAIDRVLHKASRMMERLNFPT